ncbi:hypothetical protein, partial [Aeromonas media]|uniref:hypothetical protein n=1 Tax=Aeromonas media TaxID=651 RepID=UPI003D19753E
THDEPCSMAPDDKHDLISGTCSHLPKLKYNNALADAFADLGTPDAVRRAFVGFQKYLYQGQ